MRGETEPASSVEQRLWDAARAIFRSPEDQARFVALAYQESGFNPSAHNTRGEDSYGLFQFGPEMRRAYGLEIGSPVEAQIRAGADYIRRLYEKHRGSWQDILAEHNLGLPRYRRMRAGGRDAAIDRFWSSHLPAVEAAAKRFAGSTSSATSSATSPAASRSNAEAEALTHQPFLRNRGIEWVGWNPGGSASRGSVDRLSSLLAFSRLAGASGGAVKVPPIVELMWLMGRR